ncbi:hypothetical protein D0T50_04955 [Bacteroides sp. 214]|uniref:hypothetical protein n=1 Tax=Bacteroides sp. 214 TaxID=2302935 RepID=UPI0013D52B85|nr:hypothetical protein [Bacteroides sp. 214]NDW12237.1 hypothetical protein [Bacteroides sp. 214]
MKNLLNLVVIATLSILFLSCSNEQDKFVNQPVDPYFKTMLMNKTIEIYSSKLTRGAELVLTDSEKRELAQISLNTLKTYGLSEEEIAEDLGGITDDKLIEAGLIIIAVEEEAEKGVEVIDTFDNVSLLTGLEKCPDDQTVTRSQVFNCALQAVGITAIGELMQKGIASMSRSAVKTALRKIVAKYLGWVGAAIAVYEFGDCMNWW